MSIKSLCAWLGVSRSGYYDWRKRVDSSRTCEDEALKSEIQNVYGSPRIWKALQKQGITVSRKRVARLMREIGLIARVTRGTYRAPGMRRFLSSGENLRSDGAVPGVKNKVWVADVTYLKVKNQWHYLSVVMDLHSRRIVGWSLDIKRTTEVTKRTLATAIKKRKPEKGLMLHTTEVLNTEGQNTRRILSGMVFCTA